MGSIKDRNGMDLTEAEDIKKSWQEYTESENKVAQSCPTLCNPVDCSLPGSLAHGIFQARVLEWGSIAFSRERLEISSKTLEIPREHFMQRWAQ